MRPFEYASPKTKQQAIAMLSKDWSSAVLAGGTDLVSLMKDEVVTPKRLINIKGIPDMHAVKNVKGATVVGALKTLGELSEVPGWDKQFPILFKGSRYAERLPIGNDIVLHGRKLGTHLGVNLKTEEDRRTHDLLQTDGAMLDWIAGPHFLDAYK